MWDDVEDAAEDENEDAWYFVSVSIWSRKSSPTQVTFPSQYIHVNLYS
jgi:hypothetical protein